MEGLDVSVAGALAAGFLSFVSPCVLPLVPPYLAFLGGITAEQLAQGDDIPAGAVRRVFIASLAFVLGFTTVFVALGATASSIGQLVSDHLDVLGYVAGAIILIFGLHFLGVFRIGLLYREARYHAERRPAGPVGAYVIGLAFAFGWTPCVGPVLAAILFVAAAEDSVARGAMLLAAYSAGIGIPFLLAGLAAGRFLGFMRRMRPYMHRIEQAMGLLLVLTGILFLTGSMNTLAYWLLEAFPSLGKVG